MTTARSAIAAITATLFFAIGTVPAEAGTIQVISGPMGVVPGSRAVLVAYTGPVGQSFTAIDSLLTSFGFQFETFNDVAGSPVTFSLLNGAGLGGAVLETQTLNLPTSFSTDPATFYNFNITPTAVTIGQQYTAVVSTTSYRYGIALGPNYSYATNMTVGGDAYAGGQAYFRQGSGYPNCDTGTSNCDLNFRVVGTTAAVVPEPATWLMMIAGFGFLAAALRRRRQASSAIA